MTIVVVPLPPEQWTWQRGTVHGDGCGWLELAGTEFEICLVVKISERVTPEAPYVIYHNDRFAGQARTLPEAKNMVEDFLRAFIEMGLPL